MTEMVRYYFIINPGAADRYLDGRRYITALVEKPENGFFPRSPEPFYQILSLSDRAILCDSTGCRYIKHRAVDHLSAVLDPEEFALIKLSSVEV
jgi:hypothetical protein